MNCGAHRPSKRKLAAIGLSVFTAAIAGCPNAEMPGYSANGRTIAVVTNDTHNVNCLWLVDAQTRKTTRCPMPEDWKLQSARWIRDDLWVYCSRIVGELK